MLIFSFTAYGTECSIFMKGVVSHLSCTYDNLLRSHITLIVFLQVITTLYQLLFLFDK